MNREAKILNKKMYKAVEPIEQHQNLNIYVLEVSEREEETNGTEKNIWINNG